ncbi:MAG TPA: carboxypeptidase-like regulatory domain-containing protein [Terriglobales bacterium]
MPNLKLHFVWLVVAVALAIFTPAAPGQNVYGTISGTVTDASGAAVPGATVTLTNLATSEKHTMQSGSSGEYTFVNLLPGRYRLEGEKSGFKKFVREPIVVEIESGLRVDMALQVGSQSESIEVSGETALLQPETQSLGQVVAGRNVTEMPLNGRNPLALVALVPGVVPQGQPSGGNYSGGNPVGANPFALGDFQIGGGQAGQSEILLDGVATNGAYLNVVTVVPTQDAIQEFKVQTNNLGPEYGRFAGGVINLSTKSGTNAFHGSVYEFLRNKVFDANDFFSARAKLPIPAFTQNQFGANVGGPVIKNRLFFFSSYEGYRLRKGNTITTTVPTALERSGDFSQSGYPIYDPTTSTNCTSNGPACRTQLSFNGQLNVIDPSLIDPTAQALLNYFPLPTNSGLINNYVANYSSGGDINQINERVDYNVNQNQRLFGRFTRQHILSLPDSPFKDVCGDRCTEDTISKQLALGYTITVSPKTILDLHLGYTRYTYVRTPLSKGIDLSQFGPAWAALAPQFTYTHLPTVCISQTNGDQRWGNGGSWCAAGTGSGIGAFDDTVNFNPMLSKIIGSHTLKIGGEFRLLHNNYYQSNQPAGLFSFDAGMTAPNPENSPGQAYSTTCSGGAAVCGGGYGFASFLLGYGRDGGNSNVTTPSRMAEAIKYWALYAGDTFQVSRKLTVNLGVRADFQGDWTERFNRQVALLPSAPSPIASAVGMPNLKGAFALVDSPLRSSRSPMNAWRNVSPRIGLSYQLDSNTVIRTGYGMFYLPVDVRWNDAPHNLFINTFVTPWIATVNQLGISPANPLSNPFPGGIVQPMGRNQALINVQGSGISAAVPSNPPPYVQQWNFDIQRQLPGNALIDVAYAGSKGTHLPMHSQDIDQLPPQDLPGGSAGYTLAQLTANVPNPFLGVVQSGNVSTATTIPMERLLLPYPQFDDLSMAEPDNRDSIYHSLQAKFQKRFSAGASILASYTLSKLIDNTNSEINWLEAAAPGWGDANAYNLRGERSLDGFDVPQRFVLSGVLDLPVGRGHKFASDASPVANKIIGGWGVNTIITLQRGFPLSIGGCNGLLCNAGLQNVGSPRATIVAPRKQNNGPLSSRLNEWFDTSAFAFTNNYGYGTDSRTEPNLRADGIKNIDFAAFKNTTFGPDDRIGLEFRAEFFNFFNHPQFSPPNTGCCTPVSAGGTFGQVTAQYNLPRVIQFGLRATF